MPACAAIWAMPRPMTPVPITARLRSGRETSRGMRQGGKGPILRGSAARLRGALTFPRVLGKLARARSIALTGRRREPGALRLEEPHAFTRTQAHAARAGPGAAGRGAGIPVTADHADMPLAARRIDRYPSAALCRDRHPAPGPAHRDREQARGQ